MGKAINNNKFNMPLCSKELVNYLCTHDNGLIVSQRGEVSVCTDKNELLLDRSMDSHVLVGTVHT